MIEKVVYILGAGFSAYAGIPVLSQFRFRSQDLFLSDRKRFSHFERVFDAIQSLAPVKNYFETDLFNIEEILSIMEMKDSMDDDSNPEIFSEYISDVIKESMPKVLKNEGGNEPLLSALFGNTDIWRNYGSFVASLFNLKLERGSQGMYKMFPGNPKAEYSVITFNYDRLLETGVDLINKSTFDDALAFAQSPEESSSNCPLLIKLHGDVDGTIVAPTWNKSLRPEMLTTWQSAYKSLKQADQIRFIGYSMPESDAYARYLIKSAISENRFLKSIDVICLDDDDSSVKKRYEAFVTFRGLRFKEVNVGLFLDNLATEYKNLNLRNKFGAYFNGLEKIHSRQML